MSLENGAWTKGGDTNHTEPNALGIHDNPVSGKHQAPSHWKNSGNQDTYHILTKMGGLGVKKLAKNCPIARHECKMTWHLKPSSKTCEAPAGNPLPAHTTIVSCLT